MEQCEQKPYGTEYLDLELISEQIQALAEMAAREHVASIERSQADGLFKLVSGTAHIRTTGNWRG